MTTIATKTEERGLKDPGGRYECKSVVSVLKEMKSNGEDLSYIKEHLSPEALLMFAHCF